MCVTSSIVSSAYTGGPTVQSYQLQAILDDIRFEEGDIDLPTVGFSQLEVNEIVTQGSFKYYHGHLIRQGEVESKSEENYVALKCLTGQSFSQALQWMKEIKLLYKLDHVNIRNIHTMSSTLLSDCLEDNTTHSSLGVKNRFFLVVDPVQEPLRRRMNEWAENDFKNQNTMGGVNKYDALGRVKLVGQEVARGMAYLHSQSISFGPITPERIGFDHRGKIKLIDFAQAAHHGLDTIESATTISKETAFADDIYYFGLLLWELFTLTTPKEARPPLRGTINSDQLREFISSCWNEDTKKRPIFKRIPKRLMEITSQCRHRFVAENKNEIGTEYMVSTTSKASSLKNLFRRSQSSRKSRQNLRVSKVHLLLDLVPTISDSTRKSICEETVSNNSESSIDTPCIISE